MAQMPELHLWRTVLRLGLQEAAKGDAKRWLGSKDFYTVCALAGIEAEAVLRVYDQDRFAKRRRGRQRAA